MLPADGGGEVGIDGGSEAVVEELGGCHHARAEVDGLHHAPGGEDAQHCVEVGVGGDVSQLQGVRQVLPRRHLHCETLKHKTGLTISVLVCCTGFPHFKKIF